MQDVIELLRNGKFLTRERLFLVPAALLAGYVIAVVLMFATAHGALDYRGRPLGTDFSNVYAAGKTALAGHAVLPFDPQRQYRNEQVIFGAATPFYGWHYPPYFLLLAAPLALMPYLGALMVWQLVTAALYLGALWLLLRNSPLPAAAFDRRWLLLALAFPAAFVNLTHGNNGFLTAALIASGLAMLERNQILAGAVFGLLVYKPQFLLAIPIALAFGGYWRAIGSGAFTVAALSALVTILFGIEVWPAFLASFHFARTVVLEQGNTGFNKIQSVFAWTRLWGGPVALAYVLQAITSTLAIGGLALAWRRAVPFADRGALLACAVLLGTPYSLDYDLLTLAPAIALLTARGLAKDFRPYEKSLLALLWIMPILARQVAGTLLLPLGPITLIVAAAFVAWHALGAGLRKIDVTARPKSITT